MTTSGREVIVTVTTIDGMSTEHRYPVSSSQEENQPAIDEIAAALAALRVGQDEGLSLDKPWVIYNRAHVVRIAVESSGGDGVAGEVEDLLDQVQQRTIGFRTP